MQIDDACIFCNVAVCRMAYPNVTVLVVLELMRFLDAYIFCNLAVMVDNLSYGSL